MGLDVSPQSIQRCQDLGPKVTAIQSILEFQPDELADFIIMSHVLEHLPKDDVVPTLVHIKRNILARSGKMYLAVPKGQSNTGCYWAYEDFTHHTLFTAGSVEFVLKAAGFESIDFLDPDGTYLSGPFSALVKKFLLFVYRTKINFWNRITGSSFHKPSRQIFTYDVKVLAY